ncbi:hypothetical protein MMC20_003668 [Loxospora ochrophaea]|nr:hypothetical protein [Loxospora ochrophaea]
MAFEYELWLNSVKNTYRPPRMAHRKKVAIVGSGCSGIGALWALKTSTDHEVHLFEANDRLGGHTNTVVFENEKGQKTNVDTGFIVMNTATYPNFIRFLKELDVPTVPTEMTFGVSRDQGLFEWSGTSLSSIFAQKANILKPRMWHMIFDILRFNQFALDLLSEKDESEEDPTGAGGAVSDADGPQHQESVGKYLDRERYSKGFRDDYLIPMTACVWSTRPDKCSLEFPVVTLVRFLWNHHLLSSISARPEWMTIPGGSQKYIGAVLSDFPSQFIHLKTKIDKLVVKENNQIDLHTKDGATSTFDHVVLASHGNQALDIVREAATDEEREVLSGFKTSTNTAVLHSDTSLMPTRSLTWASWNFITQSTSTSDNVSSICLTYWMNLLQHIPQETFGPVLVTLNPLRVPSPHLIQGVWEYHHPLYNAAAIRSQKMLPRIQNSRNISYAGAWTKYGFHEDGFSSGIKVAMDHLGAKLPFEFVDSTFSRGRRPVLGPMDHLLRIVLHVIQILLMVLGMVYAYFSDRPSKERMKRKI